MSKKIPVSVVVSAYNEEKKIEECLKSVQWADEVILVDNTSSDDTVKVAKKLATQIYTRPNNLMLNVNKNYGFTKVKNDWVLSLDADERITPELAEEIGKVVGSIDSGINAYYIPRKNIIFGKWIQHTGWYPDHQVRLFKKKNAKFAEEHVHELLSVDGEIDYLQNPMLHYNYETIGQFLHKAIVIYTPNEASQLLKKGYTFDYLDALRFPFREFIKRFFAEEGYKDGFHGFMLSALMGVYHFVVFAHLWEKQSFEEKESNQMLEDFGRESKELSKELKYWIYSEKINNSQSSIQKYFYKVKRKF